jgi:hypothetical protein
MDVLLIRKVEDHVLRSALYFTILNDIMGITIRA